MRLTKAQHDALVDHARDEAPNECCGYLKIEDGVVADVVRGVNERNSPYGYQMDAKSQFAMYQLGEEGLTVGSYHSHPRSPAEPSQTDINLADYEDYLYVIVSPTHEPAVRAWWIKDGRVEEEPIEVT
jgi:proteasome lid subunit RPN8/RPN11